MGDIVEGRQVNHSTVAIEELMHTVGVLDPTDRRTEPVIGEIRRLITAMPPHRVFAPEPDVLGRAALLSGMLCRLQGYASNAKRRAVEDCALFLQARSWG